MLASIADPKIELANNFWESESFKHDSLKPFILSSGVTSEYYVDCKYLMADPSYRSLVAQLSFEKIKDLDIQAIGGLEIGAIALATIISDYGFSKVGKKWKTFVVRKQVKGHGLGKRIEGAAHKGHKALVVDDVLTSGGSIIQGIQAARDSGLIVSHALVIVDRQEQEGKQKVEATGVQLISLLTLEDLKAARPGSRS